MDTNQHLYFLASRCDSSQAGYHLDGVDFHGGLRSSMSQLCSESLCVINRSGRHSVTGTLQMIHQPGRGNVLELGEQEVPSVPCLFTTDSEMSLAFSGTVTVVTNDDSFDVEELSTSGVPLCGRNWLGLLRRIDNELRMDAYVIRGVSLGASIQAYCPDWTEGFDDDGPLVFTIRLRIPA